jgi:hypothetical protein
VNFSFCLLFFPCVRHSDSSVGGRSIEALVVVLTSQVKRK